MFLERVEQAVDRVSFGGDCHLEAVARSGARAALLAGGGKIKVPCLRIEENGESRWMYESNDIIRYLESRFAKA